MVRTRTLNWWKRQKSKPDCPFFSGQRKSPVQRKSRPWGMCMVTTCRRWMNQKGCRRRRQSCVCVSVLWASLYFPCLSFWIHPVMLHIPLQILIYNTGFLRRLFLCFTTLFTTLIVTCTCIYCSLPFLENKTKQNHNQPTPLKQNKQTKNPKPISAFLLPWKQ